MKSKIFAGVVVILILTLTFGAIPVSASSGELHEFNSPGECRAAFVLDEIVVKFKNDVQPFRIVKVPEGKVGEKIQEYSRRPDVVYAEPNYIAHTTETIPNDPYYGYQWNFGTAEASGGINIAQAWDISTGNGVTVAIIDTGIAYEDYENYVQAPDLAGTIFVPGYDFVNNDSHPNDDNSHGTHVAGTVAQSTNNGIGVAGVAYNASLMPVKVLDKKGSGKYTDIAKGIRYAADNGAAVINMSLGGNYPSEAMEDALAYAYSGGVTIVAAAGNDGRSSVSYPAAYDDYVIAVGATRYDKSLAYYSNYGTSLDIVAPGGDVNVDQNGDGYGDGILQNTFNPISKRPGDFGYHFFQGTSMASPHVTGVAALLIAYGNAATPAEIRSALQDTALDLGVAGRDNTYGYGLVDAYAALGWGGTPNDPPSNESPTVSITSPTNGLTFHVNDPILFEGTATDPEEGDLSASLVWTSSIDGLIGNGGSFSTATLSEGQHTIIAAATDSAGDSSSDTISVAVVNDAPVVTISAPADGAVFDSGATIDFTGTATDYEDDDTVLTSNLVWTSDKDGQIGTGGSFSATLNDGNHTITAVVTDSNGKTTSASISITVGTPPSEPATVSIDSITWATEGGRLGDAHLLITVYLVDDLGNDVAGASVSISLDGPLNRTSTGITETDGTVTFKYPNAPSGTYTTTVTEVTADGLAWDGITTSVSFTK